MGEPPADEIPVDPDYPTPRIVPRAEHPISRKNIAEEALKVMQRLNAHGFRAYLVGGAVRDLYIGKQPKDYDIATDARPSRIKKIFRNCRIIGRRFRIAHVYFHGGKIIELATFRKSPAAPGESDGIVRSESGLIVRDNEYGTPAEDAWRRDLTINGVFYDLQTFSVIDFVGGVDDLERRVVRMINDPDTSFREDPVRMIRALRHAARTDFDIDDETLESIYRNREDIVEANPSRLLEEVLKDLRSGYSLPHFRAMVETHVLDALLPTLAEQLRETGPDHPMWSRFEMLDSWCRRGDEITTPLFLAALFHTVVLPDPDSWTGEARNPPDVWRYASRNLRDCLDHIRVSRRDTERMLQIVISFRKLMQFYAKQRIPTSVVQKVYAHEALQFLTLHLEASGEPHELVETWASKAARAQEENENSRGGGKREGASPDEAGERPRRRRRRGGRRRRRRE